MNENNNNNEKNCLICTEQLSLCWTSFVMAFWWRSKFASIVMCHGARLITLNLHCMKRREKKYEYNNKTAPYYTSTNLTCKYWRCYFRYTIYLFIFIYSREYALLSPACANHFNASIHFLLFFTLFLCFVWLEQWKKPIQKNRLQNEMKCSFLIVQFCSKMNNKWFCRAEMRAVHRSQFIII